MWPEPLITLQLGGSLIIQVEEATMIAGMPERASVKEVRQKQNLVI